MTRGVFVSLLNFEHISKLVLVFVLLTMSRKMLVGKIAADVILKMWKTSQYRVFSGLHFFTFLHSTVKLWTKKSLYSITFCAIMLFKKKGFVLKCQFRIPINTAWKVSLFGINLVCIFSHSDWITPNTDTFYAV